MLFNSFPLLAFGSFMLHASTAFAKLRSGAYFINSLDENTRVGRAHIEDKSLNPKRIVVNPGADAWEVQSLPSGRFILKNHGGIAFPRNGLVFANLLGDLDTNEEWVIQQQQRSGAYTIETADKQTGWVLSNTEQDTQVGCRPLVVGPSDPPFFPANELWQFTPAN